LIGRGTPPFTRFQLGHPAVAPGIAGIVKLVSATVAVAVSPVGVYWWPPAVCVLRLTANGPRMQLLSLGRMLGIASLRSSAAFTLPLRVITRVVVLIVPVNAVVADGCTTTPVRMMLTVAEANEMFALGNERLPLPSEVPVIDPVKLIVAGLPAA
jgi:hypothetical protein